MKRLRRRGMLLLLTFWRANIIPESGIFKGHPDLEFPNLQFAVTR